MENWNDLYIMIEDEVYPRIIRISKGTGDNLLDEDREEGYVDYINYETYILDNGILEDDGGMVLYEEYLEDKYDEIEDTVPDVLDEIFDNREMEYTIIWED